MSARALVSVAMLAAVCSAGSVASATDEKTEGLALDLFNAGKDLEDRGDYAGACAKFQQSATLDIRVGTFARLAQCEERLGQLVNARMHWARARDLAEGTHDPRAEHAAREYERVDALVPKLDLVLAGPVPQGFALALDADTLGTSALGVPMAVGAGAHVIHASALGKKPFEATVEVAGGSGMTTVDIALPDLAAAAPAPPESPTPAAAPLAPSLEPPRPSAWTTQKTLAVTAAGLGVVAAGVGTYFGLQSFAKWSDAQAECSPACAAGSTATFTKVDAQHAATAADVAFAAGAVLLAGAGVLWWTAGSPSPSQKAGRVRILALVGPATGFFASGSFGP